MVHILGRAHANYSEVTIATRHNVISVFYSSILIFFFFSWSLFPRELSVGQVLSLSLLWRGYDCMTWTVICASSSQGQRADFSIPIFFMWLRSLQWPVLGLNIMVC